MVSAIDNLKTMAGGSRVAIRTTSGVSISVRK